VRNHSELDRPECKRVCRKITRNNPTGGLSVRLRSASSEERSGMKENAQKRFRRRTLTQNVTSRICLRDLGHSLLNEMFHIREPIGISRP
jgi:hypothetical protein